MKGGVEKLAMFGGTPLFSDPLHVGAPNLGSREAYMARVEDILERRRLTNGGPYEVEFERRVAELAGVRHCIAMCNATVALEIAIRAAGLSGEVIVPSFTFIATAHALRWQEITPVFCDIDARTLTIDPAKVEAVITPRTTGIIGVHLWGRPCEVTALTELAERHGLRLLFDAAHAFGCSHRGGMIGSFGDAEVFSFHATKFINSGEGGAVVTDDDDLAERLRLMRNFGFVDYDRVDHVGTNGKMTELAAALGLTSLESLDAFIAANRRNYRCYAEGLQGIPGLSLFRHDERERCNYQYVIVEVDEAACGLSRDYIVALLRAENVLARRYFHPGCHRMAPYRSRSPESGSRLPVTERVSERVVSLPTGTAVAPEAIERICRLLAWAVRHAALIGAARPQPRAIVAPVGTSLRDEAV